MQERTNIFEKNSLVRMNFGLDTVLKTRFLPNHSIKEKIPSTHSLAQHEDIEPQLRCQLVSGHRSTNRSHLGLG